MFEASPVAPISADDEASTPAVRVANVLLNWRLLGNVRRDGLVTKIKKIRDRRIVLTMEVCGGWIQVCHMGSSGLCRMDSNPSLPDGTSLAALRFAGFCRYQSSFFSTRM